MDNQYWFSPDSDIAVLFTEYLEYITAFSNFKGNLNGIGYLWSKNVRSFIDRDPESMMKISGDFSRFDTIDLTIISQLGLFDVDDFLSYFPKNVNFVLRNSFQYEGRINDVTFIVIFQDQTIQKAVIDPRLVIDKNHAIELIKNSLKGPDNASTHR